MLILELKLLDGRAKPFVVQFPVEQLVSQSLIGFFQVTHSHGLRLRSVEDLYPVSHSAWYQYTTWPVPGKIARSQ